MSSEDDDLDARLRQLDPAGRRALLNDLESIRSLLEEESGARSSPSADASGTSAAGSKRGPEAEIPILREVVRPGRSGPAPEHAPGTDQPTPDAPAARSAREQRSTEEQGDLFDPRAFADRLLDDNWAEQRERIIDDARRGADAFSLGLDDTERSRREQDFRRQMIDQLGPRMEQVLGEAIDDLQTIMTRVVRNELERLVGDCFGSPAGKAEAAPQPRMPTQDDATD